MNKLPFEEKSTKTSSTKVRFNPEDYFEHLEGMDLTDEEAVEVLSALWDIMVQFVDLGFQIEFESDATAAASNPSPHQAKTPHNNTSRITGKGERRP